MPHVFHLIDRAAKVAAERPAIGQGSRVLLSFAGLEDQATRLAGYFIDRLGLAPQDRVAIIASNCPEFIVTLAACWRAGLTPVPMNARLHEREFAFMLDHSGAKAVVTTPDLSTTAMAAATPAIVEVLETGTPSFDAALNHERYQGSRPSPDDLAWLFYTSGTTGQPKGAMLTHRNLIAMGSSYFIDIDQIAPNDCILHAAPLSHGSGLYVVPHLMAMAAQVVPESGGFDPGEVLSLLSNWQGLSMFASPTIVNRLAHFDATGSVDLTSLKTIIYGGAPMHAGDVEAALDALGPRLAQLYGQGESPMCITGLSKRWYADRAHPRWREIIGSVGFPQSVVEVRTDESGEILVKGETVMRGYWRDENATAETLRDGWLHTGDVGHFDEDGFLKLMDRSKDLIISGGSNIYPREVEDVLLDHPMIVEASVVGAPDPEWGEKVVAFVVTQDRQAVPETELDALCQQRIARFKRPKQYIALEALPKNAHGKILKRELREIVDTP